MSDQNQETSPDTDGVAVEFGDYRILELIGTGGMAEVYRASRVEAIEGKDPAVVIKRVKPQHAGDPGFVRMFVDEARLSSQLQHPNIVSVFEYGENDGHHFIAMEYIDGLHLQGLHVRYAQRHKRSLPWRVGLHIVRDVLRGLEYAHAKADDQGRPMGLIHRDINLVNIMVSRTGGVKLLDFGIVKAADGIRSAETVGSVLKGKFGYMSPEQAEGKPLDRRSDVFAASIVLHELLTGRRLFWGKDDLEILRRVRTGDVPDPRQFAPDVPEDLVAVVNKGLARELDQRYQSAGAMADALDEVIEQHHVLGAVLRDLLRDLLGEERSEAGEKMSERRRKMTLLAWKQGVREQEAPRRRHSVAGTLGGEDARETAPGRKTSAMEASQENPDTVITTGIKWMSAEGDDALKPVLSEQAQTALEEAGEAELAEELAEELVDVEPEEPAAQDSDVASPEMADAGAPPKAKVPSLALLAAETKILEDAPELGVSEAKTQILDEETDLATAEVKTQILDEEEDLATAGAETQILDEEAAPGEPDEAGEGAAAAAPAADRGQTLAPEGDREAGRGRLKLLLLVTVLATALVLLLFFMSR